MITVSCDQNYSVTGLSRHTEYLVTVAAKNLEGLGPEASIQLRTEDGGITLYMLETHPLFRRNVTLYNIEQKLIFVKICQHIFIFHKSQVETDSLH